MLDKNNSSKDGEDMNQEEQCLNRNKSERRGIDEVVDLKSSNNPAICMVCFGDDAATLAESENNLLRQLFKFYQIRQQLNTLEEDMDNYVKFKSMGGLQKMKANVVPHIFDCQPDRKRSHKNHPRAAAVNSAMTQEQVFNQDDLQIVASSSQTSTISIHPMEVQLETSGTMPLLDIVFSKKDVSTQTHPRIRSKAVQCKLYSVVTVGLSPIKVEMKPSTSFVRSVSESSLSIQSTNPSCDESFSEIDSGSSDYTLTRNEVEVLNKENKTDFKSLNELYNYKVTKQT
ncbi:hypothetical protein HUJ05_001653 [Dendroctonus ponderosae]|nr:hypothetical protein HUJ05_001653 [Dendroctonus ponderosae]